MLEIKSKLKIPRGAYNVQVRGALRLPFHSRQKSRQHAKLDSGEEVALLLPRGEVLRGGDLVTASDGRVIEIVAAAEKLLHVECKDAKELGRAAYHLGNRHVPVEVGADYLRISADHVLEEMLRRLGAKMSPIEAPFEPEAGAYAGGHRHDEMGHGGRIHEFGEPHDRDHGHGEEHDHDHEHCDPPHHHHDHKH